MRIGFEFIVLHGSTSLYPIAEIISGALYIFFLVILVKEAHWKLFFFILALSSFSSTMVLLAKFVEWQLFPALAADRYRFTYSLLLLLTESLGLLLPYYLFFRSFERQTLLPQVEKNWRFLWLIPLVFYIVWLNSFYGNNTPAFIQAKEFFPVALKITIDLGSLLVYQMILRMMQEESKSLLQDDQLRMQDRALADLRNLDLRIDEARQIRHDVRHHLLSIQAILKNEGAEGAEQYIEELSQNRFFQVPLSFCENQLGNAILQHYYALATTKDVTYDAEVSLSKNSIFTDSEIAVSMGNLLSNALEAAALCEPGNRFVEIKSRPTTSSIYTIIVRNSYCDPPIKDAQGNYLSRHHKGPGIGLQTVKYIVDKFHGTMIITEEHNIFQVAITLYRPEEESNSSEYPG